MTDIMNFERCLVLVGVLSVAACGGGGGGGSSTDPAGGTPTSFTTIDAFQPNQTVTLRSDNAREGTALFDQQQIQAGGVSPPVGFGPFRSVDATARLALDGDADVSAIRLNTEAGTVIELDTARQDTQISVLRDGRFLAIDRAATPADPFFFVGFGRPPAVSGLYFSDPEAFGFNHMVFGLWAEVAGFAELTVGAGAFGDRTVAHNVPTAGTATYTGGLIGFASTGGAAADVSADVTLNADFADGVVGFRSTNTRSHFDVTDVAGLGVVGELDVAGLNMTGELAITGSGFNGTATTAAGWDGPVDGGFYGPNAEEAGGSFDMTGQGAERFFGSFGAAR